MRATGWLAVLALLPGAAAAHESRPERLLALEPWDTEIHLLASVEIPAGKRASAVWITLDLDRDGVLSAPERGRLEALLTQRALAGVALRVGTASAAVTQVEVKVRGADRPGTQLVALIHGTLKRPPAGTSLSVALVRNAEPLAVRILPGSAPLARTDRGTVTPEGLNVTLSAGEKLTLAW